MQLPVDAGNGMNHSVDFVSGRSTNCACGPVPMISMVATRALDFSLCAMTTARACWPSMRERNVKNASRASLERACHVVAGFPSVSTAVVFIWLASRAPAVMDCERRANTADVLGVLPSIGCGTTDDGELPRPRPGGAHACFFSSK